MAGDSRVINYHERQASQLHRHHIYPSVLALSVYLDAEQCEQAKQGRHKKIGSFV